MERPSFLWEPPSTRIVYEYSELETGGEPFEAGKGEEGLQQRGIVAG